MFEVSKKKKKQQQQAFIIQPAVKLRLCLDYRERQKSPCAMKRKSALNNNRVQGLKRKPGEKGRRETGEKKTCKEMEQNRGV